ncbi:CRISPR-associated endonuclease Cas3'' [Maricaulis sp.]|uniref:CRISPR-associated endonuclease Cas3'' n=1 Tax=Maricaulis sp. TaxID=1486257 RepID=UPI003297AE18
MAFGLAGHHAGLMDGSGHDGGTLARRLSKPIKPYDGWRDHAIGLPVLDELKAVFHPPKLNGIAPGFEMAFLARMLFSCLVDADFLETERFYSSARGDDAPRRGGSVGSHHLDAVRRFMEEHRKSGRAIVRYIGLGHSGLWSLISPNFSDFVQAAMSANKYLRQDEQRWTYKLYVRWAARAHAAQWAIGSHSEVSSQPHTATVG